MTESLDVDGVKLEEIPASGQWPDRLKISVPEDGRILLEFEVRKLYRAMRRWRSKKRFERGVTAGRRRGPWVERRRARSRVVQAELLGR